jgi:hypothetical protein
VEYVHLHHPKIPTLDINSDLKPEPEDDWNSNSEAEPEDGCDSNLDYYSLESEVSLKTNAQTINDLRGNLRIMPQTWRIIILLRPP